MNPNSSRFSSLGHHHQHRSARAWVVFCAKFDYENHSCLNYALQFNQTKLVPRPAFPGEQLLGFSKEEIQQFFWGIFLGTMIIISISLVSNINHDEALLSTLNHCNIIWYPCSFMFNGPMFSWAIFSKSQWCCTSNDRLTPASLGKRFMISNDFSVGKTMP